MVAAEKWTNKNFFYMKLLHERVMFEGADCWSGINGYWFSVPRAISFIRFTIMWLSYSVALQFLPQGALSHCSPQQCKVGAAWNFVFTSKGSLSEVNRTKRREKEQRHQAILGPLCVLFTRELLHPSPSSIPSFDSNSLLILFTSMSNVSDLHSSIQHL